MGTSHRRVARLAASFALVTTALVAAPALADGPPPDVEQSDDIAARHVIDRTTLYGDDARIPLPMTAVATSSFSYTSIGADPTQVSSPFPNEGVNCYTTAGVAKPCYSSFAGNTAQPGGQMIVTGEVGIVPRLSILGRVMVGVGGVGAVPSPDVGGTLAIRYQLLPSSWLHTHLVLSGGYIREAYNPPAFNDDKNVWVPGSAGGINAGYAQIAFSGDIERLRLGAMGHFQHTFADGRDPLDVMVDLTATYRIFGDFRLGGEYVGQDLEESFSPGAEGGARHFLGPVASLQVWNKRVTIIGGPSVGLSAISPDFVARLSASVGF
jgi:hypothetical protein